MITLDRETVLDEVDAELAKWLGPVHAARLGVKALRRGLEKMTFCEAVAKEEGFGVPNGRATRNNNPGDIEYGSFAKAHGATRIEAAPAHGAARFAYFPDAATGFAAMRALFRGHYAGMTVEQALNKYAPPVENATNAYIANVCKWTGLAKTDVVDQHL